MTQGKLIISLDCEGKWGVADEINDWYDTLLTDEALEGAYRALTTLFDKYAISATFAFVMVFTLDERERQTYAGLLRDVSVSGTNWLVNYREAEKSGNLSGWFQPRSFDLVRSSGTHEIACHGFSHLPFDEEQISEADARLDLQAAAEIASVKDVKLATFIYPRNQIGFRSLLQEHRYIGYRDRLQLPNRMRRVASLASEFNIFEKAQPSVSSTNGGLIPIPSGYFFNWRSGLRRFIPKEVTVHRWCAIMRRASERGEIAHLWLHPHNIITGPETLNVLEEVLQHAAKLRDAGNLSIVTQEEYCRTVSPVLVAS
jgi:hypothetical protein